MLEILIDSQRVDLYDDTEVSVTYEQPMLSTDRIPVPYSADINLPMTPRNRAFFGYADRLVSPVQFSSRKTRILWDGIEVCTGESSVSEISDVITITLNGSVIPQNVNKVAYRQALGEQQFVAPTIGDTGGQVVTLPSVINMAISNYFFSQLNNDYPDIVAAPVSIKARRTWSEQYQTDWDKKYGLYQTRDYASSEWINGYDALDNAYAPWGWSDQNGWINKILPAFRVGWLIDKFFGGNLTDNVFGRGELRRLMLQTLWHPRYKADADSPVYDRGPDARIFVRWADFLPNKKANEIISEMLKLVCASIYADGDSWAIEFNKDILTRTVVRDWSKKIEGTITVTQEDRARYMCGYGSDDEKLDPELSPTDLGTPVMLINRAPVTALEASTYEISKTGQYIESVSADDASGIDFDVKRCEMTPEVTDDPDVDISDFDMTFGGDPVENNVCLLKSVSDSGKGPRWVYTPQVSDAQTERSDKLLVGIYYGMQREYQYGNAQPPLYPYMSHAPYDIYGDSVGELSLSFYGDDGMAPYHAAFKSWIEKPKRRIRCNARLGALDLHALDLRDKICVRHKLYYIASITITMHPTEIDAADVELVEC